MNTMVSGKLYRPILDMAYWKRPYSRGYIKYAEPDKDLLFFIEIEKGSFKFLYKDKIVYSDMGWVWFQLIE